MKKERYTKQELLEIARLIYVRLNSRGKYCDVKLLQCKERERYIIWTNYVGRDIERYVGRNILIYKNRIIQTEHCPQYKYNIVEECVYKF